MGTLSRFRPNISPWCFRRKDNCATQKSSKPPHGLLTPSKPLCGNPNSSSTLILQNIWAKVTAKRLPGLGWLFHLVGSLSNISFSRKAVHGRTREEGGRGGSLWLSHLDKGHGSQSKSPSIEEMTLTSSDKQAVDHSVMRNMIRKQSNKTKGVPKPG